jgi:hypothetical protein
VSTELVSVLFEIDTVQSERSSAIGGFNEKLKQLRTRKDELKESHRTSTEKRDVQCAEYLIPGNEVLVRRLDTGEVVEKREANLEDLAHAGKSKRA